MQWQHLTFPGCLLQQKRGKEQLCNSFNWNTTDSDLTLSAASTATTILDFLLISSDLIVNTHLFTVAAWALLSCRLQCPTSLFLT